ncbi:hypothetical protein K439DRAFT_430337 [Ramaria rubella]|nr:hypothetical protein K439DRAFT_430337 [Ramaria rubella]
MDTAKSHDILHPSHYGLDDVYSSYFPVSPRSPEDISVAGSSKHIRQMKSTDTKYWDTLQPSSNDHDPHPLPENLQIPASTFAAYRDSPIIGKVLPFPPLSPDRPLTEKTYLWDPTEYEWRVVELDWISRSEAESQTQRPFQLPQLLAPRLRRKGHIRRASEPLNPQLLLQPPPPSPIVRTFGAYDLDESHPTLELVFRYSENLHWIAAQFWNLKQKDEFTCKFWVHLV